MGGHVGTFPGPSRLVYGGEAEAGPDIGGEGGRLGGCEAGGKTKVAVLQEVVNLVLGEVVVFPAL